MYKRIAFLDYLRVFAFGSVVIGHKFWEQFVSASEDPNIHATIRFFLHAIAPLFWGGGAGVVVFFLISGYIITHILQYEDTKDFLIKRAFRIYPLYVAAVLIELTMSHFLDGAPYPEARILIPRVLLIGDFFGTPYALANVEWTLRIEIVFYAIMAVLNYIGFFKNRARMPLIYFIAVLSLQLIGPFPSWGGFADGYFTLFMPFLFIGSCVYLIENHQAKTSHCIAFILYGYASYLILLPGVNPMSKDSHFLTLACVVFVTIWLLRNRLQSTPTLILASNLTYSVYLFHNWLWGYILLSVNALPINARYKSAIVLMVLLLLCLLLHYAIERPAITLGKFLLRHLNRKRLAESS
jgi:peptidoglycan/LPS O-acetylase OafA/YrhL